MKAEEYEERILRRRSSMGWWENVAARDYSFKDLDAGEILLTYEDAVRVGRLAPGPSRRPRDIALRLRLLTDEGAVLNAAVALFGKQILPYYPQCGYRLARFLGCDKTEFLDQKQEFGNAFAILREAEAFIRRNTTLAGRILPDRLEREDTPEYPIEAVREALVNAICHRDCSIAGGAVSVGIFDDRLEVYSTGKLAPGLKLDDLKRDHISRPPNPLIAQVFYRRALSPAPARAGRRLPAARPPRPPRLPKTLSGVSPRCPEWPEWRRHLGGQPSIVVPVPAHTGASAGAVRPARASGRRARRSVAPCRSPRARTPTAETRGQSCRAAREQPVRALQRTPLAPTSSISDHRGIDT
ncbi:MAG: hypothetical protein HY815_22410 [Candidatus Riflebacteria bacterium]|nr:hypothetical protein [Candidatus Riflebacteria bacterium]